MLAGCGATTATFEPVTEPAGKPARARPAPVTVYVDRDSIGGRCNDARPVAAARSAQTPWCSLARAVDVTPSGATVMVRRGSYPRLTIQAERRTRFVTIRSAPNETATLNGFTATNSSHWRFQALRFAGLSNLIFFGNDHVDLVRNDLTVATQVRPSRDLRFIGNTIHDLPGPPGKPEDGVGLWIVTGEQGPLRNVLIRGNRFSRLPNDAIFTDADNVTVERNTFEHIQSPDNNWAHADVFQGMGANDVTIRDNFAHDNDSGILETIAARPRLGDREQRLRPLGVLAAPARQRAAGPQARQQHLLGRRAGAAALELPAAAQPEPVRRRQQHLQPARLRPAAEPARGLEHRRRQLPAQPVRPRDARS